MMNSDTMIAIMNSDTVITGSNDYYDDMLDSEITRVRDQLSEMRRLRDEEREKFSEDQGTFCIRQHYCAQKLNHSLEKKVAKKVAPSYSHAIKKLSGNAAPPPYIIVRETELCQALHRVEIITNQLRVFVHYHKKMVKNLKTHLNEQTRIGQGIEERLLNDIKILSIDMAGITVENNAKLDKLSHQISCLKGESSNKEDSYNRRWSFSRSSSASSVVSNASSILSDASSMVSNIFLRPKNKKAGKAQRRNSIEKRVTKVCSYFGISSTAEAA